MARNSRKKATPRKPRYVIRKVDPVANAELIAEMLREGFGGGLEDAGQRATAFIGMSWWMAYEVINGAETAVGVAAMCHSAIEEGSFYLGRCYVDAAHRGHGLQKKLILARVARAKELKGTHCSSDTFDNPASTNNLIGCGFRAYMPVDPWRGRTGTMYWRLPL